MSLLNRNSRHTSPLSVAFYSLCTRKESLHGTNAIWLISSSISLSKMLVSLLSWKWWQFIMTNVAYSHRLWPYVESCLLSISDRVWWTIFSAEHSHYTRVRAQQLWECLTSLLCSAGMCRRLTGGRLCLAVGNCTVWVYWAVMLALRQACGISLSDGFS